VKAARPWTLAAAFPDVLRLVHPGEGQPESSLDKDSLDNVPAQLRRIAADIESGAVVGVQAGAVVLKVGPKLYHVYGIFDGPPLARMNAAYVLLSLALRELERVAGEIG
jgi:hypothetical protein